MCNPKRRTSNTAQHKSKVHLLSKIISSTSGQYMYSESPSTCGSAKKQRSNEYGYLLIIIETIISWRLSWWQYVQLLENHVVMGE